MKKLSIKKKVIVGSVVLLLILFGISSRNNRVTYVNSVAKTEVNRWYKIDLGSNTTTANGKPFHILTRNGESNNLIIHLQGGGLLWDGDSASKPITVSQIFRYMTGSVESLGCFTPDISPVTSNPRAIRGIFNNRNNLNPFKDWSVVYIPYTTGDLHIGNNKVTYNPDSEEQVTINHNGYNNVNEALKWAYTNFNQPDRVIISGSSAGGFGALLWSGSVAEHYNNSQVYNISDGSYLSSPKIKTAVAKYWNNDFSKNFGYTVDDDIISSSYRYYEEIRPANLKFLFAVSEFDIVLTEFNRRLNYSDDDLSYIEDWSSQMKIAVKKIDKLNLPWSLFLTDDGFNSKSGTTPHTVLESNLFYTQNEEGVYFYEWASRNILGNEELSIGRSLLK